MKLENQVSSLELSKRLKELGVKQESLFYWANVGDNDWRIGQHARYGFTVSKDDGSIIGSEVCAAFTVAELGEMLTGKAYTSGGGDLWWTCKSDELKVATSSETEANARAKMLIYLIENHLITL